MKKWKNGEKSEKEKKQKGIRPRRVPTDLDSESGPRRVPTQLTRRGEILKKDQAAPSKRGEIPKKEKNEKELGLVVSEQTLIPNQAVGRPVGRPVGRFEISRSKSPYPQILVPNGPL